MVCGYQGMLGAEWTSGALWRTDSVLVAPSGGYVMY